MEYVIKPTEQTVIFTATKHHVEYVKKVLLKYVWHQVIGRVMDNEARLRALCF